MKERQLIKVCGLREADNIAEVARLDIDMMGYVFWPDSPRFVPMISSKAGIIPDYSEERLRQADGTPATRRPAGQPARVGVFVDEMPQTIVSYVYNYRLDYVQLHGEETPEMIDNLKRTLIPDLSPQLKVIKALRVETAADLQRCRQYEGVADLLLFDTPTEQMGGSGKKFEWSLLAQYDGTLPFILSGGIGPDDADRVRAFHHPRLAGIDLNSRFETAPGVKDVSALREFIGKVRA